MKKQTNKLVTASCKIYPLFYKMLRDDASDRKEKNFSRYLNKLLEIGYKFKIGLIKEKVDIPENHRLLKFFNDHKGKKAVFRLADGSILVIPINTLDDAHEVNFMARSAYEQILNNRNRSLYFED